MAERITPFTGYKFDLTQPLSGQAMQAYRERVIEPWGELVQRRMQLSKDVDYLMVLGGQCLSCSHPPYRRRIWLWRHLRAKHS